jgi:hypothetical protein
LSVVVVDSTVVVASVVVVALVAVVVLVVVVSVVVVGKCMADYGASGGPKVRIVSADIALILRKMSSASGGPKGQIVSADILNGRAVSADIAKHSWQ